jgi:hypothetical protein
MCRPDERPRSGRSRRCDWSDGSARSDKTKSGPRSRIWSRGGSRGSSPHFRIRTRSNWTRKRTWWTHAADPMKKPGSTKDDPGVASSDSTTLTQRAGDGTRTRDVQLGKLTENNGLGASRANSGLQTPCHVVSALTIERRERPIGPQWPPTWPPIRHAFGRSARSSPLD